MKYLFTILILNVCINSNAQLPKLLTLKGKVTNKQHQPVSNVLIKLIRNSDTIASSNTDLKGDFIITVNAPKTEQKKIINLLASRLDYKDHLTTNIDLTTLNSSIDIQLQKNTRQPCGFIVIEHIPPLIDIHENGISKTISAEDRNHMAH